MSAARKHTPGPWHTYGLPAQARIIGPKGEAVASCRAKYRDRESADTRDANAMLIAAAPDMLDALRGIIESLENRYPDTGAAARIWRAIVGARAAIARATGEQS